MKSSSLPFDDVMKYIAVIVLLLLVVLFSLSVRWLMYRLGVPLWLF